MNEFDIARYLDIAKRRIWWALIPFLVVVLGGLTYLLVTPRIYEAETLILVQQQKVPENFVREIISTDLDARLASISQQVTSRTNLERVIEEYGLYKDTGMSPFDKVELLRKSIKIQITRGGRSSREAANAFSITFQGSDPKAAMEVTNALASNFITENLKIRESQALGTSDFLADELEAVQKKLAAKEGELKQYREGYMGGLPEQLDTNLRILERLQAQADQLHNSLRDAENRKLILQKEWAEIEKAGPILLQPGKGEGDSLASLKAQLASLEARYTQNHPDVIRLKGMIESLERGQAGADADSGEPDPVQPALNNPLARQLNNLELEIAGLRAEIGRNQAQIRSYQAKVEETPKREQELLSLKRDYENLKELYTSLLNRKLEAEIAVSMERKQKGEQFRVIDPAKIPQRPIKPDVRKIVMMVLALGLGLGGGLAYLVETMDTSFKTPEDLEKELQLPILVSMPIRFTEKELSRIKRRRILAAASVSVAFILSTAGIVLAVKGVDSTVHYLKSIIAGS